MKKMAQKNKDRKGETARKREKERQTCLSLSSLWYDKFMHSSCVCQSRPGVLENFSGRKEGRRGVDRKGGQEREKGERAETLSSNSRK